MLLCKGAARRAEDFFIEKHIHAQNPPPLQQKTQTFFSNQSQVDDKSRKFSMALYTEDR